MRAEHIPCGPFANSSEEQACRSILKWIRGRTGNERFVLFTNVGHSIGAGGQPDEIDLVIIGSSGVFVTEIKHWDRAFAKRNAYFVDDAADLITSKARRVAGRLRKALPTLAFVPAKLLLTKESKSFRREEVRGVNLFSVGDIEKLLEIDRLGTLADDAIDLLCRCLMPRSAALVSGGLRRIGRIADLKLLSATDDRFRRVYLGRDTLTQDQLTVHVYDLSASDAPNAEARARRGFEVVQRLQKSPWMPNLVDSFQAVAGYPGELYFYSLAESDAPPIEARFNDNDWSTPSRIEFSSTALRALAELHKPENGEGVVHRTLTPSSVRIRSNNRPLFAGWQWAHLPAAMTVSGEGDPTVDQKHSAPEVLQGGLAVADARSDVFGLCASLKGLFQSADPLAHAAAIVLARGMAENPAERASPDVLATDLIRLIAEQSANDTATSSLPSPSYWAEGTELEMHQGRYRVVSRLGHGGAGLTFKMEQVDTTTGEGLGTYVGKVVLNRDLGPPSLYAYKLVRSIAHHPSLAGIYQTAGSWSPSDLVALLRWVDGTPLGDYAGVLELYSEDVSETSGAEGAEILLLQWAKSLCQGLSVLHNAGLAHGDVSPSNIIVLGAHVTLIDYDLVTRTGEIAAGPGTPPYAPQSRREASQVTLSDDIFSLGATLFGALTDRNPFDDAGRQTQSRGLAWAEGERERFPRLATFLDRATSTNIAKRFVSAFDALAHLEAEIVTPSPTTPQRGKDPDPKKEVHLPPAFRPNEVPWLRDVLRTYPGSRYGNAETRGLDSEFAADTYVETILDTKLPREIRDGEVSLVILCGNAGDGKTAFLQHLATTLDVGQIPSERRVWEGLIDGHLKLKINLDGAASWKGKSAHTLLDELFEPFQNGRGDTKRVHLVAVNDGRLMEWVESYENRHGETQLTRQITETLAARASAFDPHIRFIELNLRSLVGGLNSTSISTDFIDKLVYRLVGGAKASEIWKPCLTCTAQTRCTAWRSARLLGASEDEVVKRQGRLLLNRLTGALQAVHQRNEVHVTARELKAVLSYSLFGLHYCNDLHENPELDPGGTHDLVFDPRSPLRQGELLRELTRLDPGLEAHARLDRYLQSDGGPSARHGAEKYPQVSLSSARRRAYFEWTADQISFVGGGDDALRLANGRHFDSFRTFPLLSTERQAQICAALCKGISRLEELPPIALQRSGIVPIRIVPRTPTETAFWVEKPLGRFSLVPERFNAVQGLETLHRFLELQYRPSTSEPLERLQISLELFCLLMDLSEGVQILDAFSDDVFANLGIFTQRLSREEQHHLFAWNPVSDHQLFEVAAERESEAQSLHFRSVEQSPQR